MDEGHRLWCKPAVQSTRTPAIGSVTTLVLQTPYLKRIDPVGVFNIFEYRTMQDNKKVMSEKYCGQVF